MARGTMTQGGRRSGWPPEQSDRARPRGLAPDDAVLTILWILVLVGLLLLMLAVLTGMLGQEIRLVNTVEAALDSRPQGALVQEPSSEQAGIAPGASAPLRDLLIGKPEMLAESAIPRDQKSVAGRPLEDVSESSGVTLGRVIESTMPSDLLGLELPYRVYLPPGYEEENRRYPVLYLLHGNGGSLQTEWTEDLRVGVVADALIAGELIQPMLIVMPDGDHSYFMNHYGTGQRWQDYIVDEVIPFIDQHFRTIPDRNSRGIAGHSMGGVGALAIAFTKPDLFGSVGAHSPSLRLTAEGGPEYFGPPEYFAKYNPLDLAATAEGIEALKISVDFGENDYWLEDGSYLLSALEERGITPEWRVSPGDHSAIYWINNEPDYLRFHSDAFAPPALP